MLTKTEELAYWLGIVQTDGCYNEYFDKKKNRVVYRIIMNVTKSLPMLVKFQEINRKLFNRKSNIYKKTTGSYESKIYVKEYLDEFNKMDFHFKDISKIPSWITENLEYFGAYVAGIIDGDGHILIRRPACPQCLVSITSGIKPEELKKIVMHKFNCSVNITTEEGISFISGREIVGHWHTLEFYISSKNSNLIEKYILPWIIMPHKKEKIERFLKERQYNKPRGLVV